MRVFSARSAESIESLVDEAHTVVQSSESIRQRTIDVAKGTGKIVMHAATVKISELSDEKVHIAVGEFTSKIPTIPPARLLSVVHEYLYTGIEDEYITGKYATVYANGKKDAVLGGKLKARITDNIDVVRFQLNHFAEFYQLLHKSPIEEPSTDSHGSTLVSGIRNVLADMPAYRLQGHPAPTRAKKIVDSRLKEGQMTA